MKSLQSYRVRSVGQEQQIKLKSFDKHTFQLYMSNVQVNLLNKDMSISCIIIHSIASYKEFNGR